MLSVFGHSFGPMAVMPSLPNEASTTRLIGAVLFEQNDEWQTASRYMMVEAFAQIDHEETTPFAALPRRPPEHDLRPSGKLHHLDGRDPRRNCRR